MAYAETYLNHANRFGSNYEGHILIAVRTRTGRCVHLAYTSGPSFCGVRRVSSSVDASKVNDAKLCPKCWPNAPGARDE